MHLLTLRDLNDFEQLLQNSNLQQALADEIIILIHQLNIQNDSVHIHSPKGPFEEIAHLVRAQLKSSHNHTSHSISIGYPESLNVETGESLSDKKMDFTIALGRPFVGFYLNQGPEVCGRVLIAGASQLKKKLIPSEKVYLMSQRLARKWLPIRQNTDNKTRGGKLLVWAGQHQMPGAASLAAQAASRCGAGYVYVSLKEILSSKPEFLWWDGKDLNPFTSVLMGPGLGVHSEHKNKIQKLKKSLIPVLLDADALTLVAQSNLDPFPDNWVLTPHAGELARLLDISSNNIEKNRIAAVRTAHKKWGGVIVLKGFHTVVALKNMTVVIPTGNVALAKAGSGDVLSGLIAGFMSQGLSSDRAALLGCYLHGLIADRWVKSGRDYLSFSPSDLIENIPETLSALRRSTKIAFYNPSF